jgi:hypothetical protein
MAVLVDQSRAPTTCEAANGWVYASLAFKAFHWRGWEYRFHAKQIFPDRSACCFSFPCARI